jgi:hypothetical protein
MISLLLLSAALALSPCQAATAHYHVLVYGSTPGGIQAAIAACSEGAAVALVSTSARVGGMMSSGLGHTDKGSEKAIGGAALKFFRDVCPSNAIPPCWDFPPSHALALFQSMLAAATNVTVFHQYSVADVTRDGTTVTSISLNSSPVTSAPLLLSADYFIDASYEGDLIAAAGACVRCNQVPCWLASPNPPQAFPQQSAEKTNACAGLHMHTTLAHTVTLLFMYNESHAGVQYEPSPYGSHQVLAPPSPLTPVRSKTASKFPPGTNPFWPNGSLLPLISSTTAGPVGSGDNKVQAYNFRQVLYARRACSLSLAHALCSSRSRRLCMTQNVSNMRPFPEPLNYEPEMWEIARRYIAATNVSSMSDLMILSPVGGGKTDTNNRGAVSTDCVGCRCAWRARVRESLTLGSYEWPAASVGRRQELWQQHKDYTLGFMWFLQHDDSLPLQVIAITAHLHILLAATSTY